MADNKIVLFGIAGVGGYLAYEYYQYSNAISNLSGGNQSTIASAEQILPFFTYLSFNWGGTASGTANQLSVYQAIQNYIQTGSAPASSPQPGTTSTSTPTSVSTAPGTTPAPLPPAPPAALPTTPARSTGIATQMEQLINMTNATADQWNWAYGQLTGQGIDAQYGFNFDTVYGPVVNGSRNNGATMSAAVFLQKAGVTTAALAPRATTRTLHGLGLIANYVGPRYSTVGNMIYQIHHPYPYIPTYTLKGLGTITQAMGFEKALIAGQPLRSNRVR